jgi:hypothetical protein
MNEDAGSIENLLLLDGSILVQECGYWIKIEARLVNPTKAVPHGIRYALTLHGRGGQRILGYDNAHAVKPPKKFKYAGQIFCWDHKHQHVSDKGVPYHFKSADQLLADFFADADRVMKEVKA